MHCENVLDRPVLLYHSLCDDLRCRTDAELRSGLPPGGAAEGPARRR